MKRGATSGARPATVVKTMTMQEPLFTEGHDAMPEHQRSGGEEAPAPVWLQRMSLVALVQFCLLVGVLLTVMPWWPRFWDHNAWLLAHPAVFAVMRQGWARGIVSGVGLLDIWIGVSEAMHYRDYRAPGDAGA